MPSRRYGKYGAIRTSIDGITFASRKEAQHYLVLKADKSVKDLELQVKFPIVVEGKKICTYICDFVYVKDKKTHIVDVKGVRTDVYKLKKKLVEALYGVTIEEV